MESELGGMYLAVSSGFVLYGILFLFDVSNKPSDDSP